MFNLLHRHLPTAELERRIAVLEENSRLDSMATDRIQIDVAENSTHDSTDTPAGVSERGSWEASNNSNADEEGDEIL